jgi:hypothetical protein
VRVLALALAPALAFVIALAAAAAHIINQNELFIPSEQCFD